MLQLAVNVAENNSIFENGFLISGIIVHSLVILHNSLLLLFP